MADLLASRKRRAATLGAGYTWFVRLAKIALPLAALVIVGVVMSRLNESPLQQVASIPEEENAESGQIELSGAQYEGVDDEGRPYTLIAKQASRDPAAPDTVLLDDLKADIVMQDGSWLAAHAAKGVYATAAQRLTLKGGVRVFHDSGYEIMLEDVDIDLSTRAAQSRAPLSGHGPAAAIRAQGVDVVDGGARVIFAGPATLTFHDVGGEG